MNRRAAELEDAVWELVADGCSDDEALAALVERFGETGLLYRFKLHERQRDTRARHEEWCSDTE
jgi:cytochrome c-type biogenesis protein CcmH/NrfF